VALTTGHIGPVLMSKELRMNRYTFIALVALIFAGCGEEVPYNEVRVVVVREDSVKIEYIENQLTDEAGDSSCTAANVSTSVTPNVAGQTIKSLSYKSRYSPCPVERADPRITVDVDDSTQFGAIEKMVNSFQDVWRSGMQFGLEAKDSTGVVSTQMKVPPWESGEANKVIEWNLIAILVDENNDYWWMCDREGPYPFDPVARDSLLHILYNCQSSSLNISFLIVIHPDALFSQYLVICDNIARLSASLSNDADFMAAYLGANRYFIDTTLGYQPRVLIKSWDWRDEAKLRKTAELTAAIPPSSLKRQYPVREIEWPRVFPRTRVANGDISPIPVPPPFVERHVIVIGNDTFPDFDQFVPVEEPPQPTNLPDPEYPAKAKLSGAVKGEVVIGILVDKTGRVRKSIILKEPEPSLGFGEAARKAAMRGKWSPALQNGYPVACWVQRKVKFKLPREESDRFQPTQEDSTSIDDTTALLPTIDSITIDAGLSNMDRPFVIDDDSLANYLGIFPVDDLPTIVRLQKLNILRVQ
jgi:TonB family protein